jgi:predicted P-loop ATPase
MSILSNAAQELDELSRARFESKLQKAKSGELRGSHLNVVTMLEEHPELRGIVGFDEFATRIILRKRPPWISNGFQPRPWQDCDDGELLCWLQKSGLPVKGPGIVAEAVQVVANRHKFDPLRDYLNGLQWDGIERLGRWLTTYAAADDSLVTQAIGRAWMISAVARGMQPGCQVDHVLMLEGAQGVGKTQTARILGGEWMLEHLPDMHSPDAPRALAGKWIVELSELAQLRRSVIETVKSFLTRRDDDVRHPFARRFQKCPRRCVFIGTTNEGEYLRDSTGNRRFWPVRIGQVDLDALRRDRDQLWAEAVVLYKAGKRWHLEDPDLVRRLAFEQAEREEEHPWAGPIYAHLSGRSETCIPAIFEDLGVNRERQDPGNAKRIGGILRRAGWVKCERKEMPGHGRSVAWRPAK